MNNMEISKNIYYIGAEDKTIDLFESQYPVPKGISYNSYLIKDKKNVVMDTIDRRKTDEWIENLENALNGEKPDYLIISHLEPDHAYNIGYLSNKYPDMKLVGNIKTFELLPQFFNIENLEDRKIVVKEGEELNIGERTLKFIMAPMVHWPEVMFTYEEKDKILFSADAFGRFGSLDLAEEWVDEARRYYFNIVGKYGAPVQAVLKKLSGLEINIICPLHGPVLKEKLEYYIQKYNIWSNYKPEENGVFIAYASIHGNTAKAIVELKKILEEYEENNIKIMDLTRCSMSEAISNAFKYDKIILAASSYNAGVFPPMEQLLNHLKCKNYQNRTIGIIENGSWAPSAARSMKSILEEMKDIKICSNIVTIKSTLNSESKEKMKELVNEILT